MKTQILIVIIGNFSYKHVYSYRSSRSEVFCKKVFLEISQNLQENTCARVSFSIKLHCENFLQVFLSIIIYFQLSGKKSQFTKNFACPLILLSSKLKIRIKFYTRERCGNDELSWRRSLPYRKQSNDLLWFDMIGISFMKYLNWLFINVAWETSYAHF